MLKRPKSYYLELQNLIHFDYHYLLVAASTSPMQCASDDHCSMLHVPCHFASFFPFENGLPKYHKKRGKFICEQFVNNLRKFQKFTVTSILHFGDIKEV